MPILTVLILVISILIYQFLLCRFLLYHFRCVHSKHSNPCYHDSIIPILVVHYKDSFHTNFDYEDLHCTFSWCTNCYYSEKQQSFIVHCRSLVLIWLLSDLGSSIFSEIGDSFDYDYHNSYKSYTFASPASQKLHMTVTDCWLYNKNSANKNIVDNTQTWKFYRNSLT